MLDGDMSRKTWLEARAGRCYLMPIDVRLGVNVSFDDKRTLDCIIKRNEQNCLSTERIILEAIESILREVPCTCLRNSPNNRSNAFPNKRRLCQTIRHHRSSHSQSINRRILFHQACLSMIQSPARDL